MERIKKIVVIGPESTGKSVLCEALAEYYQTIWCREYAREYLNENGKDYTYENLLEIAKGQIALEESCIEEVRRIESPKVRNSENTLSASPSSPLSSGLLFVDTNMYVMKVWCEYVFNQCHNFILEEIASRKYDLYLLCDTDLPWVADELREYPDEHSRKELFEIYYDILVNQDVPFKIIKGQNSKRIANAVMIVDELFIF